MKATHALVRATEYEWRKVKLFAHKSVWLPEGECVWRSEPTEQLHPKACVQSWGPSALWTNLSISHLCLWACPHQQKNRCLFTARQHRGRFMWFLAKAEWNHEYPIISGLVCLKWVESPCLKYYMDIWNHSCRQGWASLKCVFTPAPVEVCSQY